MKEKSMPRRVLEGVRVLDLGMNWAGPACTKTLADLGAQVIKIEAPGWIDPERRRPWWPNHVPGKHPYNRSPRFNEFARNKLGITLNLRSPQGLALIKELVKISDVVVENYRLGVMDRFGLNYEVLCSLRPDIIYCSMPGFGRTGPEAGYIAYGPIQEGLSGMMHLTGYPNSKPLMAGTVYGDPNAGLNAAAAVMAALWFRLRTGHGQIIDISHLEGLVAIFGDVLLDYEMNGRVQGRMGNAHPSMAPHGCYPCKNDDQWVVITVATDEEWEALRLAMEDPPWARDQRFETVHDRLRHQEEIDCYLAQWTRTVGHYEAMHRLQEFGVAAQAVLRSEEVLVDPHYQDKGFFQDVFQEDVGVTPFASPPWRYSASPADVYLPAPGLGEHNRLVLGDLVGLTELEIKNLENKNIIGDAPIDE